jgi:predicted nuclease of predicted toxin-antitoxin system
MRFLCDENFPLPSVRALRSTSLEVFSIAELEPGISDEQVLTRAIELQAVLVTFDRDFGTLLFQKAALSPKGLLYLRFEPTYPLETADFILELLRLGVILEGFFTVADREGLRQRNLQN